VKSLDYKSEFPQRGDVVYLNHAAIAPWPRRAAEAIERFARENVYQGACDYRSWLEQEGDLRRRVQRLVNAPNIEDIALLKNTSEALSVVAYGLDWRAGDNVVITDQEFPSNRIVWESLASLGVSVRQASLAQAETPEDALFACCDERTRLISVSSVQYGTGLRMDLERIGAFCREHGVLFCVDAIQSLGAIPLDVQAISADFVMADGHKWMLGPEGLAVFYCCAEQRPQLKLHQFGWHMVEHYADFDRKDWSVATTGRRFECGSPNMLGIHGLNASLSLLLEVGAQEIARNVLANTSYLYDSFNSVDEVRVISPATPERRSGIVTIRCPAPPRLQRELTAAGFICALRGGGIRFSPHFYTPREGLTALVQAVANGAR
jgi:selenocysteine lyase/cysteine desulfurase